MCVELKELSLSQILISIWKLHQNNETFFGAIKTFLKKNMQIITNKKIIKKKIHTYPMAFVWLSCGQIKH